MASNRRLPEDAKDCILGKRRSQHPKIAALALEQFLDVILISATESVQNPIPRSFAVHWRDWAAVLREWCSSVTIRRSRRKGLALRGC